MMGGVHVLIYNDVMNIENGSAHTSNVCLIPTALEDSNASEPPVVVGVGVTSITLSVAL